MKDSRILIVEDEALVAAELSDNITALGYQVTDMVNSSKKVFESIQSEKPDLVLMDIKIKGDMDGIQTAQKIKDTNGPPVIFLTAYFNDDFMARAKILEPFGYLIKPVDTRELQSTIEIALYKAKMEKERDLLLEKLTATQKELKKARQGLPICSHCKKIRNDQGGWEDLENYMYENLDTLFTHGLCPDCTSELYPDLFED
ncbi:MAG: response regulator [Desulfobacteraceae bacterium]|nr:response regulator [Desulfobacteraceae bacterium]